MFIVFNKENHKVVALLESDGGNIADDNMMQSMFPHQDSIGIWQASLPSHFTPPFLTVCLDDNSSLESVLYKNKVVYRVTPEDKKVHRAKQRATKQKKLANIYPASFLKSVMDRTTNFLRTSIYTDASIVSSLGDLSYFSDNKVIPVSWWGPITDAGGYATMNRQICFRLHNYHVMPQVGICPTANQVSSLTHYYVSHYTSLDLSRFKRYPRVWGFTPYPHPPNDGVNIIYTMMETESLHPEFVRICNAHSDEVWVPTAHNAEVFRRNRVTKPITVLPLGVDETIYQYEPDPQLGVINDSSHFIDALGRPVADGINSFRFITLFGWSFRKGTDVLIKSFVKEFTDDDDVALLIVSRYAGASDRGNASVILRDIHRYAQSVRQSKYPQIILYPDVVPEASMPSIYKMGHAFIHTSRGEGFSLPQIEASACGLPVISCNNTGMSEYLKPNNAYLITTDQTEICSSEMHWITPFYHNQLFPKVGDPQIEQARKHMRFVRGNYSDALNKGRHLRELVFGEYTWKHAAQRVAKRLREMYS